MAGTGLQVPDVAAYGGKRYLSGWVPYKTPEDWENHFGPETWERMKAAKKKYDPDQLLNLGFIDYGF